MNKDDYKQAYKECLINEVLDIALHEVGYKEDPVNITKYSKEIDKSYPEFYNTKKQGASWCDIFVDWCFIKLCKGNSDKARMMLYQPKKSCGAGCSFSYGYYKDKGATSKVPEKGYQIFFKDAKGKIVHTGLVYKVDKEKVYTVEGNKSNAVKKCSYKKDSTKIYGYGIPDYLYGYKEPAEEPSTPSTPEKPKEEIKTYKVTARSGLNLRIGPSTKYRIKTVLFYKTKIKAIDKGDWLLVKSICNDLDDTFKPLMFTGYVYKKYTKEVS